jgi:RES domain-containing protein
VITSWRIVKARYADAAFDGEGARVVGGRWNSRGTPMIYTSESAALAALELLVHLGRSRSLIDYVIFSCAFSETLVDTLGAEELPANWRAYPAPVLLQVLGDRWIRSASSAVLRIPSAVIDTESNYLLNPGHSEFRRIRISTPERFALDLRLLG